MRPTIKSLITQDLGYCCVWAFFSIFKKTPEIAARLGFSERSVRAAKRAALDGCGCEKGERCMKPQVLLFTRKLVKKSEIGQR